MSMDIKQARLRMKLTREQMSLLLGINPYRGSGKINDVLGRLERKEDVTKQLNASIHHLLFMHKKDMLDEYLENLESKDEYSK